MQGSGVGQGSSVGRRRPTQRRRRRWASKPSLRTLSGACCRASAWGVTGRQASRTSPRTLNGACAGGARQRRGASQDGGVENASARGRNRAAAALGVKTEPVHARRDVRGRRKAAVQGGGAGRRCRASARGVTGWRASRTSPRTLNGACAGGTRQRCGALQAGGGTGRERRQKYGEQKEQEHRQRHTKLR
ncbi:hypothetical protein GGX14DRAFT_475442, partial [Mycena pura]